MRRKYKLLARERVRIEFSATSAEMFAGEELFYTLHRIKALVDIPRHGVKAGDIGGYVADRRILSHDGDCWIGDHAIVWGNTMVKENALISYESTVFGGSKDIKLIVSGNAKIDGHALVQTVDGFSAHWSVISTTINEDAHIYGNAVVQNTLSVSGSSQIYDNAKVKDADYIDGEAKIYGSAFLMGENSVSGTSEVFGITTVGRKTVITGDSKIGTAGKGLNVTAELRLEDVIMAAPKNKKAADALAEKNRKAADTLSETRKFADGLLRHLGGKKTLRNEKLEYEDELRKFMDSDSYSASSDSQQISIQTLDDITARIDGYQQDIVKIIKYPLMVDTTDPFTAKMMMLLNKADRLRSFSDNKQFSDTVDSLEEAFLAAESNALRLSISKLSEDDRKKTAKATDLLSIAMDDAASDNEKQLAFKQGLKQLEGIILIPENAVETFRAKAGIAQLTA